MLVAYEAAAHTSMSDVLAGAAHRSATVLSDRWNQSSSASSSVSPSPLGGPAEDANVGPNEAAENSELSDVVQEDPLARAPCSIKSTIASRPDDDDASPRLEQQQQRAGMSPPVSPIPDGVGDALVAAAAARTAKGQAKRTILVTATPSPSVDLTAERPRTTTAAVRTDWHGVPILRSDVSLAAQSAQMQAAAMLGVAQSNSLVKGRALMRPGSGERVTTPLSSTRPWVKAQPWAASDSWKGTTDLIPEARQRTVQRRQRAHRWGARKQAVQERQAWLEKQTQSHLQQQLMQQQQQQHQWERERHQRDRERERDAVSPVQTRSAFASRGVAEIPYFRHDRSRWGVLRTQS